MESSQQSGDVLLQEIQELTGHQGGGQPLGGGQPVGGGQLLAGLDHQDDFLSVWMLMHHFLCVVEGNSG